MSDFNCNWQSNRDRVLLEEDDATLQSIINGLFINKNEIYFGDGNEPNLRDFIFSFNELSSMNKLKLKDSLSKLAPYAVLDIDKTTIKFVGDKAYLTLVVILNGRTKTISRSISKNG